MTERLVVIGGGGFGRETLDVIEAIDRAVPGTLELIGVVDDRPSDAARRRLEQRGVDWTGSIEDWLQDDDDSAYVIAIGSPTARAEVAARLDAASRRAVTLVHPSATVGSAGEILPGAVVCAGVQVSTNVRIGANVHLNPNATIGHDVVLGDGVSVNPGAVLSGDVRVGERALIGAGAVVLQGLAVGRQAVVGAAACVTRDVPAGAVVKGVPAR